VRASPLEGTDRRKGASAVQLQHLQSFLAIVEDLSFRRAAFRMSYSQPALSAHIAALECDLGVRLFVRDRTGTSLTEEGRALVPLARDAVNAVAQIERGVGHGPWRERSLAVGILVDGLRSLTWPVLRAFHDARPDVELRVVQVGFDDAVLCLAEGSIDVLFATGPFGEEDGLCTTVGHVSVGVIMPSNHPLAEEPTVGLDWLARRLTVAPPPGLGRTWSSFWTLHDVGGPPPGRLDLMPAGSDLPAMMKALSSGIVGPWPAHLPSLPSTSVRPLDADRLAPVQVVTGPRPKVTAHQLVDIAVHLGGGADREV
jgi:DNA-binding transcriptional LysR family regulator